MKHIAESHGGSIVVTSPITDDARGCAFELSIPVDRAAPRALPSPSAAATLPPEGDAASTGPKVA